MIDAKDAQQSARLLRFKSYPAYKDSGVEWLGNIPLHWNVNRTKFAARLRSGHTPSRQHLDYWYDCTIPWFALADVWQIRDGQTEHVSATNEKISELGLANSAARLLPKGSVMLSRTASVGFSAIMGVDMATTQDFVNWVCGPTLRSEYLLYVFRSMQQEFRRLTMGSTHQTIYMPDVGRFSTPIPPVPEQDQIVAFIRKETARIDALVTKKERLIELLQEKRTALIEAAVGAEGSPDTRLGYYVHLVPGYAFPSDGFTHDPDEPRLLRGVNISPDGIRWEDTVYWPVSESARFTEYRLKEGDLVFGMDRPWISTGIRVAEISAADVPSLLLQRVARLRARPGLSQKYLKLVLSSPQFRAYFEPILTGISVPHVSPEQILSFRLRLPEFDVQEAVCHRLQNHLVQIESMRDVLRTSIERLKELRTALISAAVTGKIDVRADSA